MINMVDIGRGERPNYAIEIPIREATDKSLIRADLIIDDRYKNVMDFVGPCILFDQPWNSHHQHHNRAAGWNEVVAMVRALEITRAG